MGAIGTHRQAFFITLVSSRGRTTTFVCTQHERSGKKIVFNKIKQIGSAIETRGFKPILFLGFLALI